MSTSTASALLRYVAELRDSIRHYWVMQRRHPDRAPYYKGQRKITLARACEVIQWAREELKVEKSPRSFLLEFDMEQRRERTAMLEAAE